jgi:oligopeptidase B
MSAGHGGAAGRFEELKETALAQAFAIKAVGGFGEAGA